MANPTIEAVVERLDGLERENRRLRWAAAAMLGVAMVAAGEAVAGRRPANGRVIEAERIVFRDKQGRLRGELGVDATGQPGLRFLDDRGRDQASLQVASENCATLSLFDKGDPRVTLDSSGDGSAALRFFDRAQKSTAALFMWPDSTTGLTFNLGPQSLLMGIQPGGQSALLATDREGREVGRLGHRAVNARSMGISREPLVTTAPPPPPREPEPAPDADATEPASAGAFGSHQGWSTDGPAVRRPDR